MSPPTLPESDALPSLPTVTSVPSVTSIGITLMHSSMYSTGAGLNHQLNIPSLATVRLAVV